ncbi:CybS protein [Xylariaceae sp. FL0662B]|nr:CybS protein [Xylariaceae sp. FL0662B]
MASVMRPTLLFRQSARAAKAAAALPTRPAIANDAVRVAAFHTSSRRNILPHGPQVIHGTVNDPAPVPEPHPIHGSYHWTFDRAVAVGLVPLTVAPFAAGTLSPGWDAILCALMLVHSHTGFQNIIVDYVPTNRFPRWRKAIMWSLNAATAVVGIGLYEFETNDVGVTEAIKRIWKA